MLLQTGPRFVVPFALNVGLGCLLVVAGVAVAVRFGDGDDRFGPTTYRVMSAALGLFGLGLVAIGLDFAGTMARLQTGVDRPDGTPMEPTLVGEVGLAAPWETVALALFVAGAVVTVVGVALVAREELRG